MQTVDLIEVRQEAVAYVLGTYEQAIKAFQNFNLLDVGVALIGVGTILALNAIYKDWRKKKGYRMVLRDRNDKSHAILTRVINDGLFEAECTGELSNKEVLALYQEMEKKLDLPDLVPKQKRLKIVKAELKALRNNPKYAGRNKTPRIPGDKPLQIRRFSEKIGTFANKFWKAKKAS